MASTEPTFVTRLPDEPGDKPRDLVEPIRVPPGCVYDDRHWQQFRAWCATNLRFTTGHKAGHPIVWAPFQADRIFRPVLGLYRVDDDGEPTERLIRTLYVFIPRGNAKTEAAAVLGLYDLSGAWNRHMPEQVRGARLGPEVDLFACSREQAGRMWEALQRLVVHASKPLQDDISVMTARSRALSQRSAGVAVVRSGIARKEVGLNPTTLLLDEILSQPDRKLYDVCDSSFGKRPDHLFMMMTTASTEPESFARDNHETMLKLAASPELDDTTHCVIYAAKHDTTDAEAGNEALWREVSPALDDAFLDIGVYHRAYAQALVDPAAMAAFKCFRLNVFSASPTAAFNPETWDLCAGELPDEETLAASPAYIGIDMSLTGDICSVCVLTYLDDGRACAEWAHWVSPSVVERLDSWTNQQFSVWARDPAHLITITDTNIIPVEPIADYVRTIAATRPGVKDIGFDTFRASSLQAHLSGLPTQTLNSAGWALRSAVSEACNLVANTKLVHNGDRLSRWSALNAELLQDRDGNLRLVRGDPRTSNSRIDPLSAFVFAADRRKAEERKQDEDDDNALEMVVDDDEAERLDRLAEADDWGDGWD